MLVPNDPTDSHFCSQAEIDHLHERTPQATGPSGIAQEPIAGSGLGWLDRVVRAKVVQPIDSIPEFFRNWTSWGVTLGYFFVQGTVSVILGWLPTYLTKVKHFSIMNVGFVAAAPFVGAVFGNIVGGWLSDRVFQKRRKPAMMLSSLATVVMMYALVYAPNDPVALAFILFLTGLFLSFGFSAFGIYPSAMTTKDAFPVAAALINTGGQLGAAVLPLAVGIILDRADWNAVFLFLSCCSLAGFMLLLTIIEPLQPSTNDA